MLVAVLIVAVVTPAAAQERDAEVVVDGLEFPTGIAFSPNGKVIYVNERPGRIRVVEGGELREEPLATIPTTTEGETGLLGIDVAADGSELFVFATEPDGSSNRVLRVSIDSGDTEVLVDGLPASVYHNGGGVAVDEEGRVLVSNGEIHESSHAQDPSVLGGKIYRFTQDGDAAAGNPFGAAIALGLRNPFGLTIDPVTGDAFVTDNGPSSDDEIDRIRVGGNYGWPDVLGRSEGGTPSGPGEYHDPIFVHEEIVVPTGIAIADPDEASNDVAGDLFYGTYGDQAVHRIELDDAREGPVTHEIFLREDEPVVAVEWGPDGLYYSTTSAIKLVRLARADAPRGPREPSPTAASSPEGERDDAPAPGGGISPVLWVVLAMVAIAAVLFRGRLP